MNFRYVLVDTSQQMHFDRPLSSWGASYRSLFQGHAEESLPEMAPLLIDVSRDDETCRRVIEETTRLGKLKPCVSMLDAALPLKQLADQLGQFHLVQMPNRRLMVMRWYDTRILPTWVEVLHDEQRACFTRHITAWSYFDRYGEQPSLPLSPATDQAPVVQPLTLDPAQGAALFAASEPDAVIVQLRKVIPQEIKRVPYAALYPFVSEQLLAARQHGLSELDDQTHYMLLALYTSGQFVDHPVVTPRWATPAPLHSQPFADWVAALPDSVWEAGEPFWVTAHIPAGAQA